MLPDQYLYNMNYPEYEKELCDLEMRSFFNNQKKEKIFFESIKVDPTLSPFLKNRIELMFTATSFEAIVEQLIEAKIVADDFMVKYVSLYKVDPHFSKRRAYCKDIGLHIQGFPLYSAPKIIFGITHYKDHWYFGVLKESDSVWKAHNNKPYTYSSSLGINLAKVLVNVAGNGDRTKRMIDPCCGVGTILLEGIFAGYTIEGWEINEKIAEDARNNLRYFNYDIMVTTGDIKDIMTFYDVAIVDLPYGNFSLVDSQEQRSIIKNAKRIADRLVMVSSVDISNELKSQGLDIVDVCHVRKNRLSSFTRYVWVCQA